MNKIVKSNLIPVPKVDMGLALKEVQAKVPLKVTHLGPPYKEYSVNGSSKEYSINRPLKENNPNRLSKEPIVNPPAKDNTFNQHLKENTTTTHQPALNRELLNRLTHLTHKLYVYHLFTRVRHLTKKHTFSKNYNPKQNFLFSPVWYVKCISPS